MGCASSIHCRPARDKSTVERPLGEDISCSKHRVNLYSRLRVNRGAGNKVQVLVTEPRKLQPKTTVTRGDEQELPHNEDVEVDCFDSEWKARAMALASATMPFVPARISSAFAEGLLTTVGPPPAASFQKGSRSDLLSAFQPHRSVRAAVLILDVSGFTKLSEDAQRRLGSEGVERFSLALSAFFAIMMRLIVRFKGDVDCFAGDAVLVVFEAGKSSDYSEYSLQQTQAGLIIGQLENSISEESDMGLRDAIRRALDCAMAVHSRLDGFRYETDDPPLRMHSALAAGELVCLQCGGSFAKRSEALVLGTPLSELSTALGQAQKTDIVLAPSALRLFGAQETENWEQTFLSTGHLLLHPQRSDTMARCPPAAEADVKRTLEPIRSFGTGPVVGRHNCRQSLDMLLMPSYENSVMCPPEAVVCRMQQVLKDESSTQMSSLAAITSISHDSVIAGGNGAINEGTGKAESYKRLDEMVQRYTLSNQQAPQKDLGLDALLRFMPDFVRSKCLTGHNANTLMEHRVVTILFIIADMQAHESKYHDTEWLESLQEALGSSIDTVEAEIGGATRQITVDDKGLAMIFVFGLPGYRSNRQTMPCILAARKVLDIMAGVEVKGTAGITTGVCFCGLVGAPTIRCEYAVMGDFVNTAARLASAAARQGNTILCSEAVVSATTAVQLSAHQLTLQPAGSVKLKGKHEEARVYKPVDMQRSSLDVQPSVTIEIVGREVEMELLQGVVSGKFAGGLTSVTLVGIEGPAGVGKSAILDSLMCVAMGGRGEQWMLFRGSEDSNTPFMACRNIVRWMLELDGEPEADSLSWLLGDFALGNSLPPILRRHASSIQSLRVGTQDKLADLEALYCDIIWSSLSDKHRVILLDDIDKLDTQSLRVLKRMSDRAQTGRRGHGGEVRNVHSAVICTSRAHNLLGMGKALKAVTHSLEIPSRLSVLVPPLHNKAIAEIARRSLGSSLAEPIATLVVERSNGIPLQAVELCQWLQIEELVVEGQLSAKAAGVKLDTLVPPSMQAMVQSQIDQLPTVPAVVLRCASVLGTQFNTDTLLNTLPRGIVQDKDGLADQLRVLREAHLIERVLRFEYTGSNSGDTRSTWEFCNALHQEVVYKSMAHTHRRQLHKKAAAAVKVQLTKVRGLLESRPFLTAMTRHLLLSSQVSKNSSAGEHSFIQMREDEVQTLADALLKVAENSIQLGNYLETLKYMTQLLDILKEQNDMMETKSLQLLNLESHALSTMLNRVASMSMFDPVTLQGFVGDPMNKLKELSARQDELQVAISAVHQARITSQLSSPRSSRTLTSRPSMSIFRSGFPLTRRIDFTAKIAPIGLQYFSNKGFINPANHETVLQMVQAEYPTPEEAIHIFGTICSGLMSQATVWERVLVGETGYNAFLEADESYRVNDIGGFPVIISILSMLLSGQLWSGQLCGEAEAASITALAELDNSIVSFLLTHWEAIEACWCPVRSQRVAHLFWQRSKAAEPKKPWDHLAHCMDHLYKGSASLQMMAPFLFSAHVQSASTTELLQSIHESFSAAVSESEASGHVGLHFGHACVARACVQEACSLLFPAAPAKASLLVPCPYALTPLGLQHLASLTSVLSKCLASWVKHAVNVFGEMSFLPSTLMWARSMLHLFQWVLLTAGHQTDAPQEIHLPEGLHGYSKAGEAPRPRDGPMAAFSGLQLAQQIGASRGELLVGCLPATVALARLLLAKGCCDVLYSELARTGVVVRGDVPPCVEGSPEENKVEVARVMCGSRAAREIARKQLEGVLKSVVVQGSPLNLSQVRGTADVGDSESLWEAVQLWRQLQEHETGRRGSATQAWL